MTVRDRLARADGTDKNAIDPELIRRLSLLSEDTVLDFFWHMIRASDDRLGVLLVLSRVTIQRPEDWDRAQVRLDHEQGRGRGVTLDRSRCFACECGYRNIYFHHVIEVQYGGSNAARNLVPLCFDCHQYLHPWLKDEPASWRSSGLESIWQIGRGRINLAESFS